MKKIANKILGLAVILITISVFNSCKKHTNAENIVIPPSQVHFMYKKSKRCFVNSANDSFRIRIGLTDVSNVNRTVTLSASSPTAKEGVDYMLTKKTFTIKPGQAIDQFYIKPLNVAAYLAGRRDSITISVVQPGVAASTINGSITVQLREPCVDANFVAGDFDFLLGPYEETQDDGAGAFYKTEFKSYTLTSPTTATIVINNLWDAYGDVEFDVDWSSPISGITVMPKTVVYNIDLSTLGYNVPAGRYYLAIQPSATPGFMLPCTPEFNLTYDVAYQDKTTSKITKLAANTNTVMHIIED